MRWNFRSKMVDLEKPYGKVVRKLKSLKWGVDNPSKGVCTSRKRDRLFSLR